MYLCKRRVVQDMLGMYDDLFMLGMYVRLDCSVRARYVCMYICTYVNKGV